MGTVPTRWTHFAKQPNQIIWTLDKRLFRWDNLRDIALISLLNKSLVFLAIIPVIAKAILSVPTSIKVPVLGELIHVDLRLPYSWKLFYAALLCVAVARLLYQAFCPAIVRPRRERTEFTGGHATRQFIKQQVREIYQWLWASSRKNHFLLDFCERFAANVDDLRPMLPKQAEASALSKHEIYQVVEQLELREDLAAEAHEQLHWFANEARPVVRWAAGSLYVASALLLLILLVQGSVTVFTA